MTTLNKIANIFASLCARYASDRAGQVAVVFALAALPLIGAVGAAVDYSSANGVKAQLQSALDSSLLAGAGDTSGGSVNTATNFFSGAFAPKAQVTGTQTTFTVNSDGSIAGSASTNVSTVFMGIFNFNSIKVTANSTANIASTAGASAGKAYCIIALNATMKNAINMSGSAGISAPDCFVQVNSTNTEAVAMSGSTTIRSGENCFVGKTKTYSGSAISPSPDVVCKVFSDPFASMAKPTVGACDHTNYAPANNETLQPGVYCGGINISGKNVTFASGLYIINGGILNASGTSQMTGDGVTFFLTGNGAGVNTSGGSGWHLTAMKTGSLQGFVFFLDPSCSPTSKSTLSGTSELYFDGIIYLPNQQLNLSGGSTGFTNAPFTGYIADNFNLSSSSTITINSDPTKTSVPIPGAIKTANTGGQLYLKY